MMEFNPQPMFGKHNFVTEQIILGHAMKEAERGNFMIDPNIARMGFPFMELIPMERRRNTAKHHYEQALRHLHNMGVV